jgi:hypothetical protein
MNQMVATEVTDLQALLAAKPAAPDNIPLLPNLYAAQVFSTNEKYLGFQNGQGIRFLTEYAQYSAPVNNHDLFYTFQGITTDGKYWISAFLPVNAAFLQTAPDSTDVPVGGIPAPTFDDPNYEANMITYRANMINLLNSTPDASFTPGLDCLDQYIQSLQISD